MVEAFIGLGSNVGDKFGNLQRALDLLSGTVRVTGVSRVYETDPMYETDQPPFANAAARLCVGLSPRMLLALLKQIELEVGRIGRERYGPREIDLDLLSYGRARYRYMEGGATRLVVPHPRIAERRFVLQPVADIDPTAVLPGLGRVDELLAQTDGEAASVLWREDVELSI